MGGSFEKVSPHVLKVFFRFASAFQRRAGRRVVLHLRRQNPGRREGDFDERSGIPGAFD
jgi:hypothetical protein